MMKHIDVTVYFSVAIFSIVSVSRG